MYVERYSFLLFLLERELQQGVYGMYPVYVRVGFHLRLYGLEGVCHFALGLYEVYDSKETVAVEYLLGVWPYLVGEGGEDAYDFLALLAFQFAYAVVGFHHLGWFYEHGAPGGTLVVHDAPYLALQGRYDRNDQTTVAQGRGDVFLHHALALCRAQYTI